MDAAIFHEEYKSMITLRYLFKKEEESYCSFSRSFSFEIMTREFFKRINEIEKILIEKKEFNIEKKKGDNILNYIKVFKEEHCYNVMEKNIYSCMLFFSKVDNKDSGFLGWIPKFKNTYLISLKNLDYEKKKKNTVS